VIMSHWANPRVSLKSHDQIISTGLRAEGQRWRLLDGEGGEEGHQPREKWDAGTPSELAD
jgi:hypothetical protein